jgi:hydroxymethylbilane synthase
MIRIGTRASTLAQWQAKQAAEGLQQQGVATSLVLISSEGDADQVTPLYEMGVEGIFTKALDAALLAGTIDVAVHSLKDVPTRLAEGLVQAAVLPRGATEDVLLYKTEAAALGDANFPWVIGTCSLRRKAQWKYRFPNSRFENLRGNMETRLQQLAQQPWQGAIFAKAGLERIGLLPSQFALLDWMLPAPAQGAMGLLCRQDDTRTLEMCATLNDEMTATCVQIERDFLRGLMGGCAMPIAALAQHHYSHISFSGNICLPDGSDLLEVSCTFSLDEVAEAGYTAADKLLSNGGHRLLAKLKK